ncbi:MAG: toxin-antitoxin system YwqK family antitoxin, partial [Acidobacteriota bacterium]
MGSPDNSSPPRPPTVPDDARWDPGKQAGFEWKQGALDEHGKRHGVYRSWTRDGVLHAESHYEHGELHGTNKNFHPDGSVSSEATWVRGVIMDSVYYRSDHPSPEPFAQAAPNVWSVRYYTRDGKTNFTIRYFTRDGDECGPDGKPLPPRPPSVSVDARWFPDMDRWVDGAIERGTNAQVGRWRWWQRDGVLRHEELRDGKGDPLMIADFRADGTPEKRTARDASGEQRDYYFDDGKLSLRRRSDVRGHEVYRASWFRDGSIDEETTREYDGDALQRVVERGPGGASRFEARREGPAMACVLYGRDGAQPVAIGTIERGALAGTWRICDDAGRVRREADVGALAIAQEVTGDGLEHNLGRALCRLDAPPDVPQLAGVDREPWHDIAGCYGEHVEEFPRLLRALASPDPLVRRYALGAIDSEIEHQGSTYPATA